MTRTKAAEERTNQPCNKEIEELKSYKYLLGEFGIAMLTAIYRGAQDGEAIMMLSGVPSACISGRMPILLNLELVSCIISEQYSITPKGKQFLKCINQI